MTNNSEGTQATRPLWRRIVDFPLVAMVIGVGMLVATTWLASVVIRQIPKMGTPPATRQMLLGLLVVGLVILVLLSSVATPLILRVREQSINTELQEVVNPARALLADKRAAFERGIASRAAYELSGNPSFLDRGAAWKAREDSATLALSRLVTRLDPDGRMSQLLE